MIRDVLCSPLYQTVDNFTNNYTRRVNIYSYGKKFKLQYLVRNKHQNVKSQAKERGKKKTKKTADN